MKRFYVLIAVLCLACSAIAQKADAAFVIGGSFVSDTKGSIFGPAFAENVSIKTDHHIFLEGALGLRVLNARLVSLHLDVPVAGVTSQSLSLSSSTVAPGTVVDHLSTVFVTPGVKVKILPGAPISPWGSIGGGWAHYNLKDAGASQSKGALQFGGGLDFKTGLPLLGFRAEVRDFVTSVPDFGLSNIFTSSTGFHHHNILVGGGIVLRF